MPARELYLNLPDEDKAKVLLLFKRLADFGRISNTEKFQTTWREGWIQGAWHLGIQELPNTFSWRFQTWAQIHPRARHRH